MNCFENRGNANLVTLLTKTFDRKYRKKRLKALTSDALVVFYSYSGVMWRVIKDEKKKLIARVNAVTHPRINPSQ